MNYLYINSNGEAAYTVPTFSYPGDEPRKTAVAEGIPYIQGSKTIRIASVNPPGPEEPEPREEFFTALVRSRENPGFQP